MTAAAAPIGFKFVYFQHTNMVHSGLRGTHVVALTFDDGPNPRTDEVLNVLKANHVLATFFIVGRMAHLHPEILQRIADEGHLLANHTASHQRLDTEYREDPGLLVDELHDVDDQIRSQMAPDTKFFFRAPYGIWRPEYADLLNADLILRQYVGPIYWDEGGDTSLDEAGDPVRAADWQCWKRDWTVADCARGYLNEIRQQDGGVVLMHCIHAQSAELVKAIVPVLLDDGYTFVRLDEVTGYNGHDGPSPDVEEAALSTAPLGRSSQAGPLADTARR